MLISYPTPQIAGERLGAIEASRPASAGAAQFLARRTGPIVGVISGDARDIARVFLVVHLLFAIAFAVVWVRSAPIPSTRRA